MAKALILVVDDNPTNLKLATDLLVWSEYEVAQASDAEQALAAIQVKRPALILMDVGLPGMDGLALTRQLKDNPATRGIRIVALTAFAMKGDEQRALDAGCDGYIAKPINTREFADRVAEFLAEKPAD